MIQGDAHAALAAARTSVEMSPGSAFDQATMGWILLFTGDARAAEPSIERAKRIYVIAPWWLHAIHWNELIDLGAYDAAIQAAKDSLPGTHPPFKADMLLTVAMAHYGAGNKSNVRRITAEALPMNPDLSINRFGFWDLPYIDKSIPESRYWLARELGIPETARSGN